MTGLVALLAAAGLAAAALGVQSKSFAVPGGQTRQGLAACGPGRTAVSGGFFAPLTEFGPAMVALDSTREGSRAWRLRARNLGGDGTATAYVYCARNDPGLVTRSAQFTVPGGGNRGGGSAQCQSGQEAVAGGFDSPDASTYLMASRRTDARTWRVAVYNPGGGPLQYTVFVYCDRHEPGLKTRSRTITTSETERFGQSVTAPCRQTEELRSGGFFSEFSRATDELDTDDIAIVHGSRRWGERSWRATAFAALGHPKLTAYAYCR
ncbi:MAG TPA: hypothetical protein VN458_06500 [Solirubrobacterales bacterium]|nr:hypothetical protein [Solirubrobacterales bacterium]